MRKKRWVLGVLTMALGFAGAQDLGAQAPYEADLERAKVTIEDLGARFLGPDVLQGGASYRDLGAALEHRRIRRLSVRRDPGNVHGGEVPLCVMLGTFRPGDPSTGCLPFMVDGREMSQAQVVTIAPERLAAVVVLMRREAMRLFGAQGQKGAVLLYF